MTPRAEIDLGLSRISALLCALGHPERSIPVVHVAGTNGKGSTCQYIASLLRVSPKLQVGCRIATFTSPHLVDPWDAWQINGQPADPTAYRHARGHAMAAYQGATEFEVGFAAALWYFTQGAVDVAVVEVGVGGRTDGTNVFRENIPCACGDVRKSRLLATVITRIGMDHEALLGPSLSEIAAHKAGIGARNVPCVIGPQTVPEIVGLAVQQELREGSQVYWVHVDCSKTLDVAVASDANGTNKEPVLTLPDSVLGYQVFNVATALATVAKIGHLSTSQASEAISQTRLRGRLHWVTLLGRRVLVDGAHNMDGALQLRTYLDTLPREPTLWVMGISHGKDAGSLVRTLVRDEDFVICTLFSPVTHMPWVRPMDVHVLKQLVGAETRALVLRTVDRVWDIRQWGLAHRVVVAGSLYLVADVYRWLAHGISV